MRRAIGPLWPVLSAVYGLHPWDVDHLTPDELNTYVAAAAARVAAAEQPPPDAAEPAVTVIPV